LVVSEDRIACVTVLHGSAVGVEKTFQHFQQLVVGVGKEQTIRTRN